MTAGAARFAVPPTLDPAILAGFDRAAPVVTLAGLTMGTGWQIRLARPPALDLAALEARVSAMLAGLVAAMSHWQPSLLTAFNDSPAGTWTALPPDFAAVMATALDVAERSRGAFDPAIGRLTDLWGLGPRPRGDPPGDAAIAQALARSGWHRLAFDRAGGRLRQPGGLWLDLSGVAKGYAVDAVAALLARQGLRHFLVEIGGECAGRGMRPDLEPWWVELETAPGIMLPPLRVALHGLAVATSGDYVRGAHTLDPRTGRPKTGALAAASVLAPTAAAADAWATALLVLPLGDAAALATRHGLAARLTAPGDREWLSPALTAML